MSLIKRLFIYNSQIGNHYLSADGTLNFTEGLTLVSLDITILGNILSVGETRLLYVDLLPQHPGEGGEYLRGLLILLLYVIYTIYRDNSNIVTILYG